MGENQGDVDPGDRGSRGDAADALHFSHSAGVGDIPPGTEQASLFQSGQWDLPSRPCDYHHNNHPTYNPLFLIPGRLHQRGKEYGCLLPHLLSFQHCDADTWLISCRCHIVSPGHKNKQD